MYFWKITFYTAYKNVDQTMDQYYRTKKAKNCGCYD